LAKVKNTKIIEAKLREVAKDFKSDKKELEKASRTIQNELRISLRKGIKPDGDMMKTISTKWSDRRDDLAQVNKTSKYYKPNSLNSNATFTGDFVRKIVAIVKGDKIELFGKGNHKGYKGVKGKPLKGSKASISKIILGFAGRGDILLGVTDKARSKIVDQFKRFLRRKR